MNTPFDALKLELKYEDGTASFLIESNEDCFTVGLEYANDESEWCFGLDQAKRLRDFLNFAFEHIDLANPQQEQKPDDNGN